MHSQVHIPKCDLLIHAGDFTMLGEKQWIESFNAWIKKLKEDGTIRWAIVIPGNHERSLCLSKNTQEKIDVLFSLLQDVEVLNDSETEFDGYKIYGSPITPWFYGDTWGFNIHRGEAIREYWNRIPYDTEILITHGPPAGVLDYSRFGKSGVGCEDLLEVVKRVDPLIHVFGHIHGGYGQAILDGMDTLFINASVVNEQYKVVNLPMVLDLL